MKKYLLPNALNFEAISTGHNKMMETFDILKIERELNVVKDKEISIANNYMKRQYKRLQKYINNNQNDKYEFLSKILITKSEMYRLALFNHKNPTWYYEKKSSEQKSLYKKVTKLCKELSTQIEIQRVYIPKKPGHPDKYGRPLGVPTMEWRIMPAMILNFMQGYYKKYEFKSQHGGMPFRGTKTFIEDMLRKNIYNKKYIWEFDYKGYYNNISHEAVIKVMQEINMPKIFVNWSSEALKTKPNSFKICDYNRNEDEIYLNYEKDMAIKGNELFRQTIMRQDKSIEGEYLEYLASGYSFLDATIFFEAAPYLSKEEGIKLMKMSEDQMSLENYPDKMHDMRNKEIMHNLEYEGKGLPQGLGPSPFWSSIVTYKLKELSENILMYLDDGIIYSDSLEEITQKIKKFREISDKIGVKINEEKSGFVVKEGKYLKPLKIIGTQYINNQLESMTNCGTNKVFKKADLSKIAEMLKTGELSPKDLRLGSQEADHINFNKMDHIQQMKVLIKHNLIGTILAEAWKPKETKSMSSERELIVEGIIKVIKKILKSKKSFCKDNQTANIISLGQPNLDISGAAAELQRISTKSIKIFMKYLRRKKGLK
jgi:hypothetical protein